VSKKVHGFQVDAWASLPQESERGELCRLLLGQQLRVIPHYKIQGFRIDRQAIFEWQALDHVWIKTAQSLTAVPVERR
jgi:hypothetical protein